MHKCISQSQFHKDKYNSGLLFAFILCHPLMNLPVFCFRFFASTVFFAFNVSNDIFDFSQELESALVEQDDLGTTLHNTTFSVQDFLFIQRCNIFKSSNRTTILNRKFKNKISRNRRSSFHGDYRSFSPIWNIGHRKRNQIKVRKCSIYMCI